MATNNYLENELASIRNSRQLLTKFGAHFVGSSNTITIDGNLAVGGTLSAGSETTTSQTITAASANAFTVGANGTTNPVLNIDSSTASVATGLNVKGAAAGGGLGLSVITSGTNEALKIDGAGSGTIGINTTSTTSGAVTIGNGTSLAGLLINGPINTATASNTLNIGTTSTGVIQLGTTGAGSVFLVSGSNIRLQGNNKATIVKLTTVALGTAQNSTPTGAQLYGGVVTQTGATGAGTVTLDTGTNISTAVPNNQTGDTFQCLFANLGGGFNLVITGATGATVVGNGTVPSGKNALMTFVCTGSNTWNVYVTVSA